MRIALVQARLVWAGGIERFVSSVLGKLGSGNEVAVFTFDYDRSALAEASGYEIHIIPYGGDFLGHFRAYFRYRHLARFYGELRGWKPDLVILQQPEAIRLASWLSSKLPGVAIIPYVHDVWTLEMLRKLEESEERRRREGGALRALYFRLISRGIYWSKELDGAGPVACVSQYVSDRVSEFWPNVRTRVIYNGVDHDYFVPTWEDEGYALCVSRIDRTKNLDFILESFKDAPYPVVVCGNIFANNRSSETYARELASKSSGQVQLRLNVGQDNLRGLIQKCSILLQPGKGEGFGLVPVEGMACGKPVIAHRSGATPEVVDGGGILLGDDAKEWRRAADDLMSSPEVRKELGRKALAHSLKFSWDATAQEVVDLCRDAVSSQQRRRVSGPRSRIAFVFSGDYAYPPNIHDMKSYYLTKELLSRGERVTWIGLGGRDRVRFAEGIEFLNVPTPVWSGLRSVQALLRMALLCVSRRIRVVYMDDWMFFRKRPLRLLAGVICLRVARIKIVMDERDPTVDFETATGELVVGSSKYEQTLRATRLSEGMSSLVLLTSKAYERLYVSEGFPRGKVMGAFRGVDTALFNPGVDPATVRRRLGLDGKFVIGWFGLMHSFRLIREVLIPMVQNIAKTMPDAHVLIGGEGPLLGEFQDLAKDSGLPLTVLGLVPYSELPSHVAACDVLLCPVNRGFRHTQNSAWLKIAEALAVGRPVIATRTRLSEFDFKELKGVLWVEPTLASFMDALKELREGYPRYLSLAQEQSRNFGDYSISHTISRIVDRIELQLEGPVN